MPKPPLEIQIDWAAIPPGQLGSRPATVPINTTLTFTSTDPTFTGIEFKERSPLHDGSQRAAPNAVVTAAVAGRFKFKCHRQDPNGQDHVLDPDDPNVPGGGGEIEVIP